MKDLPRQSQFRSVLNCLKLLDRRSKILLGLLSAAQGFSALMDVAAIYMLAIATTQATILASGNEVSALSIPFLPEAGAAETGSPYTGLALLAGLAVALLILRSLVSLAITRYSLHFLARRQAEISDFLAHGFFSQSFSDIRSKDAAAVSYTLTWGTSVSVIGVIGQTVNVASEVLILAVLFSGLAIVDPSLAFGSLVYFAIILLLFHRLLSVRAHRVGRLVTENEVRGQQEILNLLQVARELSLSGRLDTSVDSFVNARRVSYHAEASLALASILPRYILDVALVIGLISVAVLEFATSEFAAAIATLVLFTATAARIVPSLMRMQSSLLQMRGSLPQAQPAIDLHESLGMWARERPVVTSLKRTHEPPRDQSVRGVTVQALNAAINFPGLAPHKGLRHINFTIDAGAFIGILGPSGAGKTTLVEAVLGLRPLSAGSLVIDGASPLDYVRSHPGSLSYVPQDVAIVSGDVIDNVALGYSRDSVDVERVWSAVESAQLADFLKVERDGLETELGDGGVRLSGGQRQRVGLARALYQNPDLLVIDEGTSALDSATELKIMDAVADLRGQATVVVIAHRHSTLKVCDYILEVEGGRVRRVEAPA